MSESKNLERFKALAKRLLSERDSLRKDLRRKSVRVEDLEAENRYLRSVLNRQRAIRSRLATIPLAARIRGHGRKTDVFEADE